MQSRMLGRESAARVARVSAQKERRSRHFMGAKLLMEPLDGRHFLSPALSPGSPGARENRPPSLSHTRDDVCQASVHKTRGSRKLFPLPEGEGQGEGKRLTADFNFAWSAVSVNRTLTM